MKSVELLPPGEPLVFSFRVFRHLTQDVLRSGERRKFNKNWPGYRLIGWMAVGSVGLVSHTETKKIAAESTFFAENNLMVAMAKIMNPPATTARQSIELPVAGLRYKKPRGLSQKYKIQILLDDQEGILEEERSVYLRNLSRLTEEDLNFDDFEAGLSIGRTRPLTTGPELSPEPLKALENLIPDEIKLSRVRVHTIEGIDEIY